MENCLVTKLMSSVDNNELKRLRMLTVKVKGTSVNDNPRTIRMGNSKAFKVFSINGGFTYNGNHYSGEDNPANIPAGTYIWITLDNGEYELYITEKYTITYFFPNTNDNVIFGINIDDIKAYTSISSLGMCGQMNKGHIESLETINTFFIRNTKITGDISCLAGRTLYSPLPSIIQYNGIFIDKSPMITGDIVNLSGIDNRLTELSVDTTSIYGSVESLIDGLNRETGSFAIYAGHSNVTYTGKTFAELGISVVRYNFETGVYTTS